MTYVRMTSDEYEYWIIEYLKEAVRINNKNSYDYVLQIFSDRAIEVGLKYPGIRFVERMLDCFDIPSSDLSLKQRLAYFNIVGYRLNESS